MSSRDEPCQTSGEPSPYQAASSSSLHGLHTRKQQMLEEHDGDDDVLSAREYKPGSGFGDDVHTAFLRRFTGSLSSAPNVSGHHGSIAPGRLRTGISASTPVLASAPTNTTAESLLADRTRAMVKAQEQNGIISAAGSERQAPILKGGYQANFAGEVRDNLRCPICLLVIRDAVQTPCGHLYCESCIRTVLTGKNPRCPMDQKELTYSFADRHCRREVLQLLVLCDNKEECSWVGNLVELAAHLDSCEYVTASCSNIGCTTKLQRRKLSTHMTLDCQYRQECCPHCKASFLVAKLTVHIRNDCPDVEITCPVPGCVETMPRHRTTEHLDKECKERDILCSLGCGEKVKRGLMDEHMQDQVMSARHTRHLSETVVRLESALDASQSRAERLEQQVYMLKEQPGDRMYQELWRMVECLQRDVLEVQRSSQHAIPALAERVTACETLSQHNVCSLRDIGNSVRDVKATTERRAVQEEKILQQLDALDLRMLERETTSYDGTLVWKIPGFNTILDEAQNGGKTSHYSQPFYTGRNGYKACARLYPNGDGAGHGKSISLFFVVMAGEFDAILPWPFHQRVTFTLIDQAPRSHHHVSETFLPDTRSSSFQRPTAGMNVASGCPCFVSHQTLRSSSHQYLRDNTLFLRIRIDKTDLTH